MFFFYLSFDWFKLNQICFLFLSFFPGSINLYLWCQLLQSCLLYHLFHRFFVVCFLCLCCDKKCRSITQNYQSLYILNCIDGMNCLQKILDLFILHESVSLEERNTDSHKVYDTPYSKRYNHIRLWPSPYTSLWIIQNLHTYISNNTKRSLYFYIN